MGEPIRLYCICRTADESATMIGCDKCDEWYHFECVGIDQTQIPDIESYEFICPACQKKQSKQQQLQSKKTLSSAQTNLNKRNAKAQQKKMLQSTSVYDFIQNTSNSVRINNPGGGSAQLQSASVQQKRKFQKQRGQQMAPQNAKPVAGQKGGKKAVASGKHKSPAGLDSQTNMMGSGRMILNTNLGGGRMSGADRHLGS